ncbi:hypothetical protein PSMK_06680 [Phycisphaera mikurensis NBRC 102666]|uniref:Uncharacterized protein n=1 Tax=Phycisphaera mikurensis (strain NBRC 102666 / KCTC 22515 / FYK2301M01) TaxID=1142394 RepID=I0IC39_PHYMF|nr:hypothetical protein PSMK_06680 [Phycisphaera mikurensis NBRC 102666]
MCASVSAKLEVDAEAAAYRPLDTVCRDHPQAPPARGRADREPPWTHCSTSPASS